MLLCAIIQSRLFNHYHLLVLFKNYFYYVKSFSVDFLTIYLQVLFKNYFLLCEILQYKLFNYNYLLVLFKTIFPTIFSECNHSV